MTNIYYSKFNIKDIFVVILFSIGVVSLLFNYYISLVMLIIIVSIFNGQFTDDLFVIQDKRIYFLSKNKSMNLRYPILIVLFLGLGLCFCRYYIISLSIFYSIILLEYIVDLIVYLGIIRKIAGTDILKDKLPDYKYYLLTSAKGKKSIYEFELDSIDTHEQISIEYKMSKSIFMYKELCKQIENL